MNKNRTRKFRQRKFNYDALENRQLLAAVVMGGSGGDTVKVDFVDANTVNILTNKTLRENVDVTNGLNVNLGVGNDKILIDHRITADVHIAHVETIEIDGGDNDWKIGFKTLGIATGNHPQAFSVIPSYSAGQINDNIRFYDAWVLQSGNGVDTYSIDTTSSRSIQIRSGGGDDLFRLNQTSSDGAKVEVASFETTQTVSPWFIVDFGITVNGESGNDRFVYIGEGSSKSAIGGEGNDVVDYRQRAQGVGHVVGRVFDGDWQEGVEKVIAPLEGQNEIYTRIQTKGTGLSWVINGNQTILTDAQSGQSMEFLNFNQFRGDSRAFDRFWILETAEDINLIDADWVQVSSNIDATKGGLETIQHDISITRDGFQRIEPGVFLYANIVDDDGVIHPEVVISDQASTESIFGFVHDKSIRGLTTGEIKFVGRHLERDSNLEKDKRFQPNVTIHGSEFDDYFLIASNAVPVTIESQSGDDTFMLGSSNKDANGNLEGIDAEVNLKAGDGTDRIYLNDQAFSQREVGYRIRATGISEIEKFPMIGEDDDSSAVAYPQHFANVNFGSAEIVRVNGSATMLNDFVVTSSAQTRFFVDGSSQTDFEDKLTALSSSKSHALSNNNGDGAFTFDADALPVFFVGIENVSPNVFIDIDGLIAADFV